MNGPRKLKVYIPEVDNCRTIQFKDGNDERDSIHWKAKNEKGSKIKIYKNKEPVWSDSTRS